MCMLVCVRVCVCVLGLIVQLKPEIFTMLMKVQTKMVVVIKSVGNIEHEAYPYFMRSWSEWVLRDSGLDPVISLVH